MDSSVKDQSYVPAHLAIEAMRDNGYKNTAYAVAELIDNSIEAGADKVQLLCVEKEYNLATRKAKKLDKIAILDNGIGMSKDVLALALQFGNGTRLERKQRKGIGRFGMGLPASSISQCKRVEVWSWQNGIENANYVYLDIEEIKTKKATAMPEPVLKTIPDIWLEAAEVFSETGTLVVWNELDRMMWNRGQTLVKHSELLIGRMYRKFLDNQSMTINMKVFDINDHTNSTINKNALPNDPVYLMNNTSCPSPFNQEPMFEPFGGPAHYEIKFDVPFQGEVHELYVRLSIAKDIAREEENSGSKLYGLHAKENTGISIVRAGRELELTQALVIQHVTTERWWGVEVEFPPSLDELMGVTNNKQSARNLTDVLKNIDEIANQVKKGKDILTIRDEFIEEGDPRAPLIEVCYEINRQITNMRKSIKIQTTGLKTKLRHEGIDAEKKATAQTDARKELGYVGQTDKDEKKPEAERATAIREVLEESGVEEGRARLIAENTVKNNLKYSFTKTPFEGDAFFTVRPSGGAINILLNTNHPAFENLVEVLDGQNQKTDEENLKERLIKASEGLRLLLAAWARYEDETPDGTLRDHIQNVRQSWGKFAKDFLKNVE